jgi:hypothetical protein
MIDFRPLTDIERRNLIASLCGNAKENKAIIMNQRDTSFVGVSDEVPEEEVINAIRSVPCHY